MTLRHLLICFLSIFLISCSTETNRAPSLGVAYVGPATLNLRQELAPKSAVSGTAKHGDRLEIIENKRRFVKVRTEQGAEGWTDTHLLLTPEQMTGLREMAESASKYPSQGAASVFEPLNMHTEPSRTSPSFWQIPESAKVDVIGHKLTPRLSAPPASAAPRMIPPRAKPRRKGKGQSQAQSKLAPPPTPAAPKPPENWLELSVPREDVLQSEKKAPAKPAAPPAPVAMDDWSLVRTKDGKVGWVLTRALNLAIPDEVAQYAEGHRITAYFALGDAGQGNDVKNSWLWTTITKGGQPYEFDSVRVFVWSKKHHRYETAYIERKLVGHYPIDVKNSGPSPSFTLLVDGNDGHLYRKKYMFEGYHVHVVAKELADAPKAEAPKPVVEKPVVEPSKKAAWYSRYADRVRHWFKK